MTNKNEKVKEYGKMIFELLSDLERGLLIGVSLTLDELNVDCATVLEL